MVDREALQKALQDPNTRAALDVVVTGGLPETSDHPQYLEDSPAEPTLGQWG
jgi:hypothetical protein